MVLFKLLWKFIVSTSYYSNEVDTYSRIPQSDFYVNVLYFVWTSFWYLPAYILLLGLVSVWFRTYSPHLAQITLCLLLISYAFTLIDYQAFNSTTLPFYRAESWNTLLTNSINKYHPFIFYSTIFGLVLTYWSSMIAPWHTWLSSFSGFYSQHALLQDKLIYIVFTLFLGSWWAAQEGSWGGWWNWDPSEVFGLVVMIFFTQIVHRHLLKHTRYALQLVIGSFVLIILVLYLFIQLNFDLVSHNFGTKASQFIDSYQLLLILSSIAVYFWGRQFTTLVTFLTRSKVQALVSQQILGQRVMFAITLLVVTVLSFTDLFNNFSWSIVGTNLVNLPDLSTYYSTISILILVILLYKPSLTVLPVTYVVTVSTHVLPYTLLSRFIKSWISFNHILVSLMLFTTYICVNQTSTIWHQVTDNSQTFLLGTLSDLGKIYPTLNTCVVEVGYLQSWANQVSGYGWNIFKDSSVALVHTFSHPLGPNGQSQGMLAAGTEYLHSIQVTDLFSSSLGWVVLFVLASINTLVTSKPIITY